MRDKRFVFLQSVFAIVFLVMNCFAESGYAASVEQNLVVTSPQNHTKHDLPLMVIRFNFANVMYEKSLYDTVERGLRAKPSARFEVVSVAKKSSDSDIQKRYDELAARNIDKVLTTFHEMGVPDERVSQGKSRENIKYNEVRIYIH